MSDLQAVKATVERMLAESEAISTADRDLGSIASIYSRRGTLKDVLKVIAEHEGGVKPDEITTAPARTTDPQTSKEPPRKLTSTNACGKLAAAFYRAAEGDAQYAIAVFVPSREGLTVDQAIESADLSHLRCPWKRVSDLKRANIVEPTGHTWKDPDTGMDQEMLRITAHGRAEVERLGLHRSAS